MAELPSEMVPVLVPPPPRTTAAPAPSVIVPVLLRRALIVKELVLVFCKMPALLNWEAGPEEGPVMNCPVSVKVPAARLLTTAPP